MRTDFPHQSPRGLTNHFIRGPERFLLTRHQQPMSGIQNLRKAKPPGIQQSLCRNRDQARSSKEGEQRATDHFNGAELRTSEQLTSPTKPTSPFSGLPHFQREIFTCKTYHPYSYNNIVRHSEHIIIINNLFEIVNHVK